MSFQPKNVILTNLLSNRDIAQENPKFDFCGKTIKARKLAVDYMPDIHKFSANRTGGVPVLGGSNQVLESKILLTNIGKIKKSLSVT